mgnify:FL=1
MDRAAELLRILNPPSCSNDYFERGFVTNTDPTKDAYGVNVDKQSLELFDKLGSPLKPI